MNEQEQSSTRTFPTSDALAFIFPDDEPLFATPVFDGHIAGFHPARFWAKVQKTESCWLWTGTTDKGQGRMRINGKVMVAHRVSWIIAHGDSLGSKAVLHSCGVLACVNPAHLSLGKTHLRAIAKAAVPPRPPCKEPDCGGPRWRRSNWCGAHQNPDTRTPLRCIAPKGGRRSKSVEKCGAILGWANESGYCPEHRYLAEVDRTKHPRPTKPCIEPGCTTRHTCKGDYCRAHRHLSPESKKRVNKFMRKQAVDAKRLRATALPDNWPMKPAGWVFIGSILKQHTYISNPALAILLDDCKHKCPYADDWHTALSGAKRGGSKRAVDYIWEIRNWVGKPARPDKAA